MNNIDNSNIPFADKVQLPTIRDQIAITTLTGLIYNSDFGYDDYVSEAKLEVITETAYKIADAMLKARAKSNP